MAQTDFLIIPLKPHFSYLDYVKEQEAREHERQIRRLKRALWWHENVYCGSDGAFWDMVCSEALGLEVR